MVFETFDLSQGFEKPALFNVKTVFKGKYANLRREWFLTRNSEKVKNIYLEYYKEFYPSIVANEELEIRDDVGKK